MKLALKEKEKEKNKNKNKMTQNPVNGITEDEEPIKSSIEEDNDLSIIAGMTTLTPSSNHDLSKLKKAQSESKKSSGTTDLLGFLEEEDITSKKQDTTKGKAKVTPTPIAGKTVTQSGEQPPSITVNSLTKSSVIKNGKNGRTALHKAIAKDNIPLAIDLCLNKENIEIPDENGDTALHLAATRTNRPDDKLLPKLFKQFQECGANFSIQNIKGETPLHLAVAANCVDTVSFLATSDKATGNIAKSNQKKSPGLSIPSPLHYALSQKTLNPDIIDALFNGNHQVDINLQNSNGDTPFYLALQHANVNNISRKVLSQMFKSCDVTTVNKDQKTLLHAAFNNQQIDEEIYMAILKLFKVKSNINLQDKQGNTPLYYTLENQDNDKAASILSEKPNPNIFKNYSPLHIAIRNNNLDLVKRLLKLKADVNAKDAKGNTPFHYAVRSGNSQIVQLLKNYNAMVTEELKKWAVETAMLQNDPIILLVLLEEFKANPDIHVTIPSQTRNTGLLGYVISAASDPGSSQSSDSDRFKNKWIQEGDTVLHYAIRQGNEELAKACLTNNPNVIHSLNGKGKTPAHVVIKVLNPSLAHLLWQNGAKEKSDKTTSTPLMQAATRGFESITQLSDFFSNRSYQLTSKQKFLADEVATKYRSPPR